MQNSPGSSQPGAPATSVRSPATDDANDGAPGRTERARLGRLFRRSPFNTNVLTMLGGTSIAQAVPILVSPILTRLYTPDDFGTFALYGALAALLLITATGRYELAIILPEEDARARSIVLLVLASAVGMGLVVLGGVVALSGVLAGLLNNPAIRPWLFLLPISIVASATYVAFYYYQNRVAGFRTMSAAQVQQTSVTATANVGLGIWQVAQGGLILGTIAGQLSSAWFLTRRSVRAFRGTRFDRHALRRSAVQYRNFPLFQLPATFIETMSAHAPTLLLSGFFGPAVVGMYSLSQRVVRIPITMVGSAIGDVFRQDAGRHYVAFGEARAVFLETLAKLVVISVVPFAVFALTAPTLFHIAFGAEWYEAGRYARILTPMFWLSFVVSPLSNMFMIAEKQAVDLAMQVTLIVSSVAALFAGYRLGGRPEAVLGLFAAVYCAKYLVELYLSYRFATDRSDNK